MFLLEDGLSIILGLENYEVYYCNYNMAKSLIYSLKEASALLYLFIKLSKLFCIVV
jgi:hypothetical protein